MAQAAAQFTRPRQLSDKLQELAGRSPKHLHAVEVFVDLALEQLHEADRAAIYDASHQYRLRE